MDARTLLADYGVSAATGFLPHTGPLRQLTDPYYAPWEDAVRALSERIATQTVHSTVHDMPVLLPTNLTTEAQWRRAYVVLAFLTQAYVWSGQTPRDVLPPQLAIPLLEVAQHHDLPPIATYASLVLWNFAFQSPLCDLTDPINLRSLHTMTGLKDEEWFYLISVALESRGGPIVRQLLNCMGAALSKNDQALIESLRRTTANIKSIGLLLERMYERCDTQTYYHDVRPLLAGTKGMASVGLPKGVFFDLGEGKGAWKQYSGGSNGQSSLIQLLDIALGIEHHATGASRGRIAEAGVKSKANGYMSDMRNYMPGPHRRFLAYVEENTNVREYCISDSAPDAVKAAYNETVTALSQFRDIHIQIVTRYIITPSRLPPAPHVLKKNVGLNLASASSQASAEGGKKPELYGTGGTDLLPFLKQTRDETKDSVSR